MATKAFIQNLIDTNLADNSDILPEEHRDVEDALLDEMFPDSVRLTFNGTTQTSGTPNITVPSSVAANWKVFYDFHFEKIGNRVFYSGFIRSEETSKALGLVGGITLATFATTLLRPLSTHPSASILINYNVANGTYLPNASMIMSIDGIVLQGSIPFGETDYIIEGSYKVAN
jgi:hypothetical protein